ncbi:hypothetical protein QR680_009024 [Steinernema hermaphroditum]|uniref:Protein kinase domain-containing protein n=1 Tax=Steinernema hermaphroditum TaxID=289476 RepID=A0AA39IIU0_9BILA|nr:hypothetical protein QR680_009024 [Steinernema hermaphroditum]
MEDPARSVEDSLYEYLRANMLEIMKSQQPQPRNVLRIKADYKGEKRSIEVNRPADFGALRRILQQTFGRALNIYYTISTSELIVPIRNQAELDRAVEIVDNCSKQKSLRLILSRHHTNEVDAPPQSPDVRGVYSSIPARVVDCAWSETCSSKASSNPYYWRTLSRATSSSTDPYALPELAELRPAGATPKAPTNWRQGRCLGSGAFGQVFVCYDVETGRELALKRVHCDSRLSKHVSSFENEINLLSTIQHPRIVQYMGLQRTDSSIVIFMEYMSGGSVKDLIDQFGALSTSVARKYTFQILQGLAYLHHHEIVHRDLKSANILRDCDGNVKIGDFGSGKRLQTIVSQHGASFIGTPQYMAPEVVKGERRFGRKADIWSVGITIVEMLTAKTPWHDTLLEPIAVILKIAYDQPTYELPPETDDSLRALLEAMLTTNPEGRPTAKELIASHPAFEPLRAS